MTVLNLIRSPLFPSCTKALVTFRTWWEIDDVPDKQRQLAIAVESFADEMAKFYPSENERKVVGLRRLKFSVAMFSCRLDTPNVKMKFRILQRYPDEQDNHYLYIAEILDKKLILVKFTERYSIELHAFCASRGRAPRILGFERIAGGWSVIAMEYIHPAVHPSESTDLTRLCDQWADLRELVRSFHGEGWVHGDLRRPNMICNGETRLGWQNRGGTLSDCTAL